VLSLVGGRNQVAGYFAAVEESGLDIETIPIIRGWAVAGGRITKEAFDLFHKKIADGLKVAGKIDGLMLQLHGACAAEGVDDVEGAQAELCRKILGPDVPIVGAFDHHANITQKLMDNLDAIAGHRTQPHDVFDTGKIGGELLFAIVTGKVKPTMAWRKIPLISHQEQFLTSKGPMKIWFDRARQMEKDDPRVARIANWPMQPWLDVDEGGWAATVVTNNDMALADKLADELADLAWSMRDDFQVKDALPVDEAVRKADKAAKGIVVLSDTGDTVFGGAAGDSNLIAESILRLGIKSKTLIPLISAKTVAELVAAGEGATVTVKIGGDSAPAFFTPLEVTGTVRRIADGSRVKLNYNHQDYVDMGRVVIFDVGPITMLVTEKRGVAGNLPDAYSAFGVEPTDYKIAVVKTASNFQYFAPLTSEVIRADTGGPGQSDVQGLPWKRIPRPVYPLDPIDDWRDAQAKRGAPG
jgi:microcystin degradation protein MlrC